MLKNPPTDELFNSVPTSCTYVRNEHDSVICRSVQYCTIVIVLHGPIFGVAVLGGGGGGGGGGVKRTPVPYLPYLGAYRVRVARSLIHPGQPNGEWPG